LITRTIEIMYRAARSPGESEFFQILMERRRVSFQMMGMLNNLKTRKYTKDSVLFGFVNGRGQLEIYLAAWQKLSDGGYEFHKQSIQW
jgi:hypothetical protein